ncbi:MAG: nitrophenyl compound nitroreductase subunit ArsF family protein [Candidatus Omnitrophota bacterium]
MDYLKRYIIMLFFWSILFIPVILVEEGSGDTDDCVNIYYFHGASRCANCYKIEEYTKEAAEKFFEKELVSGRLVYMAINIDEKENSHFIKDYQLCSKSVVLSMVKGGKEVEYKELEKIWGYIGDKERFLNYIKEEVNEFLNFKEKAVK